MDISKINFTSSGKPYFKYWTPNTVKNGNKRKGYWVKTWGVIRKCPVCQKDFFLTHTLMKEKPDFKRTCSNLCAGTFRRGVNNHRWKGGKSINRQGYVYIRAYDHPTKDRRGYVLEHRLVMEKHLGRYLEPWEIVHHKNHDRQDNRLENLELVSHTHNFDVENRLKKEVIRLREILTKHAITFLLLLSLWIFPSFVFAEEINFERLADAIYKAEGVNSRFPFGIKSVKCTGYAECRRVCVNTLRNTEQRWLKAGRPTDYLTFLGNRYCPPSAHALNRHWRNNVARLYAQGGQ